MAHHQLARRVQRVDRGEVARADALELDDDAADVLLVDLGEQVLLALDVVVHRAQPHAHRGGDVAHARLRVPLLGEEPRRRGGDLRTAVTAGADGGGSGLPGHGPPY